MGNKKITFGEKEFEKAQIVFFNGVQYFHRILTEDAQ